MPASSLSGNNSESVTSRFLCLDTCVILDIVRDPTRNDIRTRDHTASLELLSMAERSKDLIVYIAEQVRNEFHNNVDVVQEESKNALSKFRDTASKIDQLSALYGASGRTDLSHLNNHEVRCREVADRWMKIGVPVHPSGHVFSRAFTRINQALTPAKKGKNSMADCVILETYLEHIHKLRSDGITGHAVFVSSNTRDYAGTSGAAIRDDIEQEFDNLKLEYAPNMAAAEHFLKL